MNPTKVDRNHLLRLTDLPNVGPACEKDLRLIGIRVPAHLRGRDAYDMYAQLCLRTGVMHDPCVIAYLLRPDLFTARVANVEIELSPGLSYGQTVADFWQVTDRKPNATVLTGLDAPGFFDLLWERLSRYT